MTHKITAPLVMLMALVAGLPVLLHEQRQEPSSEDPFRFKGGVDFVAVHTTITDSSGRLPTAKGGMVTKSGSWAVSTSARSWDSSVRRAGLGSW